MERAEFAPDSGILGVWGVGIVIYGLFVVAAALDYRALSARGVPRPFHWAWTFLSALVYIIGRTVVARRRTGTGLAPLWVTIATLVVTGVAIEVVVFPFIAGATSSLTP
jgi:cytochrome bd-type quinol oxidase subunit 2